MSKQWEMLFFIILGAQQQLEHITHRECNNINTTYLQTASQYSLVPVAFRNSLSFEMINKAVHHYGQDANILEFLNL